MVSFQLGSLAVSVLIILFYFFLSRLLRIAIRKLGELKQVPVLRYEHVYKYFRAILIVLAAVVLLTVWGVDYRGLVVIASSILALLAVALVAQWSILSNITAGVLIFFSFPARIGDKIEIIDGNTSLKGEIHEINLFQVILKDEKEQLIAYPNNLVLQKAVRKLDDGAKLKTAEAHSKWRKRELDRSKEKDA